MAKTARKRSSRTTSYFSFSIEVPATWVTEQVKRHLKGDQKRLASFERALRTGKFGTGKEARKLTKFDRDMYKQEVERGSRQVFLNKCTLKTLAKSSTPGANNFVFISPEMAAHLLR